MREYNWRTLHAQLQAVAQSIKDDIAVIEDARQKLEIDRGHETPPALAQIASGLRGKRYALLGIAEELIELY